MNEIPKNNPFKIPENYLENFNVSQVEIEGRSVFKAPDNYFDQFKVELPKEKSTSKIINLFNSYKISAIAAAVSILIAVPLLLKTTSSSSIEFDQLSFQEIDTYLHSTQTTFDNYELASELPQGISEMDFLASNGSDIEAYINLQIEEFSEINLYSNEY